MKKIKVSILLIAIFFISIITVKAECPTSELNGLRQQANKIIYDVELKEELVDPGEGEMMYNVYYYNINFYNLNENLFLVGNGYISNILDVWDGKLTVQYSSLEYATLNFDVYANTDNCFADLDALRSIEVIIPQYNTYSTSYECIEIPDCYYCQKTFPTQVEISREDFDAGVNKCLNNQLTSSEEKPIEKNNNFLKDYGIWIALGLLLIGAITFIIIKIKKKDDRGIV